jgi:hypothetical protein
MNENIQQVIPKDVFPSKMIINSKGKQRKWTLVDI